MKMDDKYIGVKFSTLVRGEKSKDSWRVFYDVTYERSEDLETWEEKTVSIESFDKDLERAVASAAVTIGQYLSALNWDLFEDEDANTIDDKSKEVLN